MNRRETTKFLSELLIMNKLSGAGKHWASEVSLDALTTDVKRVDFMLFEPANACSVDGIEKGIFTSFEIKSCMADYNSGHGLNFETEKNYIVMPMALWRKFTPAGTGKDLDELPQIPHNVGVLVPVPTYRTEYEEFEDPTPLDKSGVIWRFVAIRNARMSLRKRSLTELLFCMLRSGH